MDVDRFRELIADCGTHGHAMNDFCPRCIRSLDAAVGSYGGEFMAGFGLKDSVNFDDWHYFQADQLRRELADALDRLVLHHSAQCDFEPAVGYARRRLGLDPLDERAHRWLMRLYAWSGQRSAAIRQYNECVALLQEQVGVPPQEATTDLGRTIKEGRAPPLPSPGPLPKPAARAPSFLEAVPP